MRNRPPFAARVRVQLKAAFARAQDHGCGCCGEAFDSRDPYGDDYPVWSQALPPAPSERPPTANYWLLRRECCTRRQGLPLDAEARARFDAVQSDVQPELDRILAADWRARQTWRAAA